MTRPPTDSITVIVPVRNKATYLDRCVRSVVDSANLAGDVEIVLVDNDSSDDSARILVQEFGSCSRIIHSAAANAASVRNAGARGARGNILCFLDADCLVPIDYFAKIRTVFSIPWIDAAGCAVDLPENGSWIERTWHRLHYRGSSGFRSYINSGNFALRRRVFEAVGGFDESLETGEDANLGARLERDGHPPFESRLLSVVHVDNPTSLRRFFHKEIWHALGMFGTTGFGRLDKPVVTTILHVILLAFAGIVVIAAIVAGRPAGLALAVVLPFLIPLMTVAYRKALAARDASWIAGIVLYSTYFLARSVALVRLGGAWFARSLSARPVEKTVGMSLRSWMKSAGEVTLAGPVGRLAGIRRRRGSCLILAYHNVVPQASLQAGDISLHLSLDQFRRQLDLLAACGRVASLERCIRPGSRGDGLVAITFDDAYLGAISAALPELVARGLPATVFVAPGLLGSRSAWWDTWAASDEPTSSKRRDQCLTQFFGDGGQIDREARARGWEAQRSDTFRIAEESRLLMETSKGRFTLAGHSWTHPDLTRVDDSRLKRELGLGLKWLSNCAARTMPWLAFPYGRHDPRVIAAARDAGYTALFRVDGGWHPSTGASIVVPRFNVPAGLSLRGFAARINGALRR